MYYVSCHHILIHYDCFIPGLTDCKDEVSSIGVTSMRPPFASNYVTDSMLAQYYARGRCGNGQNNPILYVSKKKKFVPCTVNNILWYTVRNGFLSMHFFWYTSYLYHIVWFLYLTLLFLIFLHVQCCTALKQLQNTFNRTTFTPNIVCIVIYYLRIPCEQFLIGG